MVEMTVHAGTHVDTPHHFFRDMPGIEQLPLDSMIGEAIVMGCSTNRAISRTPSCSTRRCS